MKELVKFSSQLDRKVLMAIRKIADEQGRKLQDIIDESLRDYMEKVRTGKPRPHVLEAFGKSMLTYDSLYDKLAK